MQWYQGTDKLNNLAPNLTLIFHATQTYLIVIFFY